MVECLCDQVGVYIGKLWFAGFGGVKIAKKLQFRLERIQVGTQYRLVVRFWDTISGHHDLVRFEALIKPYRSTRAATAEKLLSARNLKANIGCSVGMVVPMFVWQGQLSVFWLFMVQCPCEPGR